MNSPSPTSPTVDLERPQEALRKRCNGYLKHDQGTAGESPAATAIQCLFCGKPLTTARSDKQFCNAACRRQHWGDRNVLRITFPKFPPLKPNAPLTKEDPNVRSA